MQSKASPRMMLRPRAPTASMRRYFSTHFGPPPSRPQRRIVVTGLGAVTPLGVTVESSWERLINAECGISSIESFDTTGLGASIAGQVRRGVSDSKVEFNALDWIDLRNKRSQDVDFISFAMAAATQALEDANWSPKSIKDQERTGIAIGSGIGNIQDIIDVAEFINEKKYRKVSPFFVPRILLNLAAGHISIKHNIKGVNHSCVTACATGAHSIGDAFGFIQRGDVDVMVAGGTESCVNPVSIVGFGRAKALATNFNETPHEASRPFDAKRSGFVMGEGAGVMVLEEYEHAKARSAKIYGEIRGYGLSSDAYHITAPEENGDGAFRAMRCALNQAGFSPDMVDYINAHATSTPIGDKAENRAIKRLFGEESKVAVSSTKGATGHLLGAAGSVEAIFALKSIETNIYPPTLNCHELEKDEFTLNYVPLKAQNSDRTDVVLTNSFGFGGTNASLCFSRI